MDSLKDQLKKFQSIYDEMLSNQNWESSPFLKLIHSKLKKLKMELDEVFDLETEINHFAKSSEKDQGFEPDLFEKIYIYLYTTEGKKIEGWQRLIMNLDKQYISRPIYRSEIEVQYAVYNAPIFHNAGYVAIWVEKKFILSQEDFAKDKFGHDLLLLKDRAVHLNKIDYFWTDSNQYQWIDGKLVFFKAVTRVKK